MRNAQYAIRNTQYAMGLKVALQIRNTKYAIRNTQYAMGLKVALQIRNTQYAIRNGSQSGQRIYAFCVFRYAIRNGPQRATCVFGSIRNTQKSSKIRSRSIRCVYRMGHSCFRHSPALHKSQDTVACCTCNTDILAWLH